MSPSGLAETASAGGLPRLIARVAMLVHLLMQAVDVSTEARLEGRSSRRYANTIKGIAKRWAAENTTPASAPKPSGEALLSLA
jgi:hypothetical protein